MGRDDSIDRWKGAGVDDKKEGGVTICGPHPLAPPGPSRGADVVITITLLFGPVEALSKEQLRIIRSMGGEGVRLVLRKRIARLVMQRVRVEHYQRICEALENRSVPFTLID